MDRKTVGLLGAVAGLVTTIGSAQAAINPAPDASPALQVSSYTDLLAPIPDAAALLKAEDAAQAQAAAEAPGGVQFTQYYPYYYSPYYYNYNPYPYYSYPYYSYPYYHHHHHHHHHHRYYRRRYHHHHHHHAAFFAVPGAAKTVG